MRTFTTFTTLLFCCASLAMAAEGMLTRINHAGENVSAPTPGLGYTNVGTSVITLFSTNASRTMGRSVIREVRNMGTVPVMYAINHTNVATNSLHGVLAAGTAIRDGLGGWRDFSATPFPISFRTATGNADLAILEVTQD